jgi:hypothetical protein
MCSHVRVPFAAGAYSTFALEQLYLLDENGQLISECNDAQKLGYYSPYDGCRLHIVDLDPNSASSGGWLEDVSLVKKYEISEEAYNARKNTYRNFRKQKLAEDPNWTYKTDLESRQGKEAAAVSKTSSIPVQRASIPATRTPAHRRPTYFLRPNSPPPLNPTGASQSLPPALKRERHGHRGTHARQGRGRKLPGSGSSGD